MKQSRWVSFFVLLFISVGVIPPLFAGSAEYLYDDLGRLVRVTDANNNRVLYQYDEVGNLISIDKEDAPPQSLPPVLQDANPDIFLVGQSYNIIITGQNLLTTTGITSDNPNVTIKLSAALDTKISAFLVVGNGASPGQTTLTVATSHGSASLVINLYRLNISPEVISLFPSKTGSLLIELTPSAPTNLQVEIINNNPSIVEAQPSTTIPPGSNGNLSITGLKEGVGMIGVGGEEATIYVFGDGALMNATPVSVYIDQSPIVEATPVAVPVSVSLEEYSVMNAVTASNSASVRLEEPATVNTTRVAHPVSVYLPQLPTVSATKYSGPVSLNVEVSSAGATIISPFVGVVISSQ